MDSDGSDPPLSVLVSSRPLGRGGFERTLNARAESRLTVGRVSPFGHLRIKARLPAPRSFSQAATSFIACNRQGIHHMHFVA
jgi:hypothetical protein